MADNANELTQELADLAIKSGLVTSGVVVILGKDGALHETHFGFGNSVAREVEYTVEEVPEVTEEPKLEIVEAETE
jgi:hypothetical protein